MKMVNRGDYECFLCQEIQNMHFGVFVIAADDHDEDTATRCRTT